MNKVLKPDFNINLIYNLSTYLLTMRNQKWFMCPSIRIFYVTQKEINEQSKKPMEINVRKLLQRLLQEKWQLMSL